MQCLSAKEIKRAPPTKKSDGSVNRKEDGGDGNTEAPPGQVIEHRWERYVNPISPPPTPKHFP